MAISIDLRSEIVDGVRQWMGEQSIVGDFIIHFSDGAHGYGEMPDPRGYRFVHVFVQDETNPRHLAYYSTRLGGNPLLVRIAGHDVSGASADEMITDEAIKLELMEIEKILEEAHELEKAADSLLEDDFFERLQFDMCPNCGEYHVPKNKENGNVEDQGVVECTRPRREEVR